MNASFNCYVSKKQTIVDTTNMTHTARCTSCKLVFAAGLVKQFSNERRCPICGGNDLIRMSDGFDATAPGNTRHVVPANAVQYAGLREEAVLLASEDGVDYYYAPASREYLAALPDGSIAAGGREYKTGPVAMARALYVATIERLQF